MVWSPMANLNVAHYQATIRRIAYHFFNQQ